MGAFYPKFNAQNPAEVESSWGAILYMIYSFFYVGLTLALEAVWVRMYFYHRMGSYPMSWPAIAVIMVFLVLLNIAANILPLRLGLKNLKFIELTI